MLVGRRRGRKGEGRERRRRRRRRREEKKGRRVFDSTLFLAPRAVSDGQLTDFTEAHLTRFAQVCKSLSCILLQPAFKPACGPACAPFRGHVVATFFRVSQRKRAAQLFPWLGEVYLQELRERAIRSLRIRMLAEAIITLSGIWLLLLLVRRIVVHTYIRSPRAIHKHTD